MTENRINRPNLSDRRERERGKEKEREKERGEREMERERTPTAVFIFFLSLSHCQSDSVELTDAFFSVYITLHARTMVLTVYGGERGEPNFRFPILRRHSCGNKGERRREREREP